jgi:hypothetical protein
MTDISRCELCGEPMPPGEEMFKYHGYSGNCPKLPLPPLVKEIGVIAGIAIDNWKLPVFERHLSKAKYGYKVCPGLTEDTLLIQVFTDSIIKLEPIVRAANAECAATGRKP